MWRKNRSFHENDPCIGTDLNRNFASKHWCGRLFVLFWVMFLHEKGDIHKERHINSDRKGLSESGNHLHNKHFS